jgi:hypothetical protein
MVIPDKIAISFFTAVVVSEAAAIAALWFKVNALQEQIFTILHK